MAKKQKAVPKKPSGLANLTPAQKAAATRAARKAEQERLDKANAQRLAQIVNLHIAGFDLAEIGAQIGASADEVDRLLAADAARYVRSQPALRTYVRNWISARYAQMIEADWEEATDRSHPKKLENQDRVDRFLSQMAKLHGAPAPVQTEVTIEHAPEAIDRMVATLAAQRGLTYDDDIFDADVVEDDGVVEDEGVAADLVAETAEALEVSGNRVEEPQEDDEEPL